MEAIEFLKEAKRKCLSTPCDACRDERLGVMCPLLEYSDEKLEQLVSGVEQWSKEHPIITNAKKFEEVFGLSGHRLIHPGANWWDEPYEGAET